jgi:hypothetical protein
MEKVTVRQLRDSRIIDLAVKGTPVFEIARQVGAAKSTVDRTLNNSVNQEKLKECLDQMNARVNSELPFMLTLALSAVKSTFEADRFCSTSDKLKAAKIVIDLAVELNRITSRNQPLPCTDM